MYISQRDKILGILKTAEIAMNYMAAGGSRLLAGETREGIDAALRYAKNTGCGPEALEKLLCLSAHMPSVHSGMDELWESIRLLNQAVRTLREEPARYKAVFLPYKASMWTSMESIWRQAAADPDCDAMVVPIPYMEMEKGEVHYEIHDFPPEVPVLSSEGIDLKREEPEMVFFHNPYDDTNNLTRVSPRFYSSNLKECTKCLVYTPYFTINNFTPGQNDFQYMAPGEQNADKIVVQSPFVRKIYMDQYGYPPDKLLAFGSPKIDAVINKKKADMPAGWKEKLTGRKVFLLNTHLSYFPQGAAGLSEYGFNYAEKYHRDILSAFVNRKGCGLIWRPHPFMMAMLEGRFPGCLEFVRHFRKTIEESDNSVVDEFADYSYAFQYSDALITTYSSILNEYLVTGKPVLIFQGKPADKVAEQSPMDLRTCYFRFKKDGGLYFRQFRDMILRGEDPGYEERMSMLRNRAFANMDGTAGIHIYEHIKKYIRR